MLFNIKHIPYFSEKMYLCCVEVPMHYLYCKLQIAIHTIIQVKITIYFEYIKIYNCLYNITNILLKKGIGIDLTM